MTDYTNYIEESLNALMPEVLLLEKKEEKIVYTKDAPKIKGYFKFISIRYMKRMRDIKKLCVEYINTYVESALNVAKNMDDVRIVDEQNKDTLAKDLEFAKTGVNTNGSQKSATSKEGVLFLTGDKALLDKINAIADKINVRATKNKMLMEWANLMLIQSKIVANDIIRKETTKLLKEEKTRKEQERKNEEKKRKEQEKADKVMKENIEKQKTNSALYSEYGSPDDVAAKLNLTVKEIKQMFKTTGNDFFNENLANPDDNTELDKSVAINEERTKFYHKCGAGKLIKDAIVFATDGVSETPVQHFRFASYMVENCDIKKGEYPYPVDIMVAAVNNDKVSINDSVKKPFDKIKEEDYKNEDIKAEEVFKSENEYTDKAYTLKCAFLYLSTLSKQNSILESKGSILSTSQFIAESALNTQKEKIENEMMLLDVLSDYEDHIALEMPFGTKDGAVCVVEVDENGSPVFKDINDNMLNLTDDEVGEITYYIINNY